jgi:toxin ParE1/3/4
MAQIIWTEPAVNDLNEIAEYIALNNPMAAAELVRDVVTKVERLEQFPKSGKNLIEIPELNYREVVASPCRAFYRLDKTSVYIVHVCRDERDLRKFLIARGNL